MEVLQLNGFCCGVIRTEEIPVSQIKEIQQEWSRSGMTCWITYPVKRYNQQALDVEYNKNMPNQ